MPINYRARRENLNLTLDQVSQMVGVGKSTVQRWESGGISNITAQHIIKYSNVLKISPMEIVDPNHESKSDETIKRTVEVMKDLSERRQERVFGFALSQLEDDY